MHPFAADASSHMKSPIRTSGKPWKVEPLSRDEEQALAREYRETRDPALARRLVESHMRLVAKIARQCSSRNALLGDLIQEGCLGLIRAVEKYDPDRGVRLSSYAAWWIRAYIYQYILANSRMMKVATTFAQRKIFFNLNKETERMRAAGKEVDTQEIAGRLHVSEATVVEMTSRLGGREVQFDTTGAVDSLHTRGDGAAAPLRPDEDVENRQTAAAVRSRMADVMQHLDDRERAICEQRLMAERPSTLRELGVQFGISRERARQLEERLKAKLRTVMRDLAEETATQQTARAA